MPEGWQAAGQAWGHRAVDWAALAEPVFWPAYEAVFARVSLGPGERLCDVACGSGGALVVAARRGAVTAGLDASTSLVEVARHRTGHSDVRVGDQDDLPWDDDTFDVVTSFNGIWHGGDRALAEVARVTRPAGRIAITFWGPWDQMQWLSFLFALNVVSAPGELEANRDHVSIGEAGVGEAMFARAGIDVVERFDVDTETLWPDDEIAWRSMASSGVGYGAIAHSGEEAARSAALAALAPFWVDGVGYRTTNRVSALVGRA
ncbi:MAG: class I SAM-dependent methyltransferase [Actinomycetota bacterium]|nr:class I SAM-dependent methyltransferase [Actinomycetota bacterium]